MAGEEKIFDRLCEEDETLSLEDALKKSLLQETKLKSKFCTTDVNFVRGRSQSSNGGGNNNNNSSNQTGRARTPCKHCGWKSHQSNVCKFKEAICRACNKKGHLAPVCKFKQKKIANFIQNNDSLSVPVDCDNSSNEILNSSNTDNGACGALVRTGVDKNFPIFNVKSGVASTSFRLTVSINGFCFEDVKCDTGAPCSLMSKGTFERFFDRNSLKVKRNVYTDYGNHPLAYIGEFSAIVMYRNEEKRVTFIVTDTNQPTLLGESFFNLLVSF